MSETSVAEFDPLKTRAEQGLDEIPWFLKSEKNYRKFLRQRGLRESSPNEDGWTTLERIPSPPMFPHARNEPTRYDIIDPSITPDNEEITVRERNAYLGRIKVRQRKTA